MSDEKIERLPKWAQWRISNMGKELADLRRSMDNYAGTEPTVICVDPDAAHIRNGSYPRYLPERTAIEYKLEHGDIEVSLRDGQHPVDALVRFTACSRGSARRGE